MSKAMEALDLVWSAGQEGLCADEKCPSCYATREAHALLRDYITTTEAALAEKDEGDGWMVKADAALANGTCPICRASDEDGHEKGCAWGDEVAEKDAALRVAREAMKERRNSIEPHDISDVYVARMDEVDAQVEKAIGGPDA